MDGHDREANRGLPSATKAVDWKIDSKAAFADAMTFCVRGMQVSGAASFNCLARRATCQA
jgi:hypothetical protein